MNIEELKYPIGPLTPPPTVNDELISSWIEDIELFPNRLCDTVIGLSDEQLDTPYRPEGWTVRQLVHHCADSHMNAFTRFKLALTEHNPTIRPYFEARWAELPDGKELKIEGSILILKGLHYRWSELLKSLTSDQKNRSLYHPEGNRELILGPYIWDYAWHCNHHLAHIEKLKEREGWR